MTHCTDAETGNRSGSKFYEGHDSFNRKLIPGLQDALGTFLRNSARKL